MVLSLPTGCCAGTSRTITCSGINLPIAVFSRSSVFSFTAEWYSNTFYFFRLPPRRMDVFDNFQNEIGSTFFTMRLRIVLSPATTIHNTTGLKHRFAAKTAFAHIKISIISTLSLFSFVMRYFKNWNSLIFQCAQRTNTVVSGQCSEWEQEQDRVS